MVIGYDEMIMGYLEHSADESEEKDEKDKGATDGETDEKDEKVETIEDIFKSMNDKQQTAVFAMIGRELLMRLNKYPQIPPLMVIESFRDECDSYSCLNPKTSYTFSCAKDMLEWIIDLLIS